MYYSLVLVSGIILSNSIFLFRFSTIRFLSPMYTASVVAVWRRFGYSYLSWFHVVFNNHFCDCTYVHCIRCTQMFWFIIYWKLLLTSFTWVSFVIFKSLSLSIFKVLFRIIHSLLTCTLQFLFVCTLVVLRFQFFSSVLFFCICILVTILPYYVFSVLETWFILCVNLYIHPVLMMFTAIFILLSYH